MKEKIGTICVTLISIVLIFKDSPLMALFVLMAYGFYKLEKDEST